jgi:hypothetical protein
MVYFLLKDTLNGNDCTTEHGDIDDLITRLLDDAHISVNPRSPEVPELLATIPFLAFRRVEAVDEESGRSTPVTMHDLVKAMSSSHATISFMNEIKQALKQGK